MKIRRLSETDLARIAPLSSDQKRRALEYLKSGFPRFSYNPVKKTWDDILNVQSELFGSANPTSWKEIYRVISKWSRSEEEFDSNIGVAKALHDAAVEGAWQSKRHEIYPMALGASGMKVEFWLQIVIAVDGRPVVPFFEPRRSSTRLTAAGRRFVFSSMHERIRVPDPDMSEIELGIFQFGQNSDGTRALQLHKSDGVEFYSYDELNHMVSETYTIWKEILEGREREIRRKAAGLRGDLL